MRIGPSRGVRVSLNSESHLAGVYYGADTSDGAVAGYLRPRDGLSAHQPCSAAARPLPGDPTPCPRGSVCSSIVVPPLENLGLPFHAWHFSGMVQGGIGPDTGRSAGWRRLGARSAQARSERVRPAIQVLIPRRRALAPNWLQLAARADPLARPQARERLPAHEAAAGLGLPTAGF